MDQIRDVRGKEKSEIPCFGCEGQGRWDIIFQDTGRRDLGMGQGGNGEFCFACVRVDFPRRPPNGDFK